MPDPRKLIASKIRKAGIAMTARRIGVSRPALSFWLTGRNSLGSEKVDELLELFGFRRTTTIIKKAG